MIETKDIWGYEVVIKYSTEDNPVAMIFLDEDDKWVKPYLLPMIERYQSSRGKANE